MAENFLINSHLVSYWMFEDSASPSLDGTANDNDLTWSTDGGTNPTQSTTHKQGSFSVQLTDGAIVQRAFASLSAGFPATASTTAGWTFGGWIYASTYPTSGQQVIQLLDAIATGGWGLNTNGGTQGDQLEFDGTGGVISSDSTYSLNTWHLVVFRYNGDNRSGAGADNEQSFWIDNVKQTTTFTPAAWALATVNPLKWHANSGTQLYDEWFVFDYALLDTQIADIFNSGLAGSGDSPLARRMGTIEHGRKIIGVQNVRSF